MTRNPIPTAAWVCCAATFALLACAQQPLEAAGLKFEAQLVWGTGDDRSPDPKHKPVEPEVRQKLKELPLKYSNYFEVNRKCFEVPPAGLSKVSLSDKCELQVKSVGGSRIEVTLLGKGKETLKRTQPLPKSEMLVLGGNAPNSTAWLVVIKRVE
jgi:hypothetical protein